MKGGKPPHTFYIKSLSTLFVCPSTSPSLQSVFHITNTKGQLCVFEFSASCHISTFNPFFNLIFSLSVSFSPTPL